MENEREKNARLKAEAMASKDEVGAVGNSCCCRWRWRCSLQMPMCPTVF